MVKAMYAPTAGSGLIQPYVSAAAGVNVIHFSEYVGEFNSLDNSSVGFTAEAGAGLKIPFGQHERAGFLLGASYRFSPYNKYEIKNLNTVNLHAGLQFRISK
jgi:hypothetical protein